MDELRTYPEFAVKQNNGPILFAQLPVKGPPVPVVQLLQISYMKAGEVVSCANVRRWTALTTHYRRTRRSRDVVKGALTDILSYGLPESPA